MRKYIHAYKIGNECLFRDIKSWSDTDLNGNEAMIVSYNTNESGYENISSIETWDAYGKPFEKRKQIEYIFNDTKWQSLNNTEKQIIAKHFLVEKSLRDEVLTEADQELYNYFKIYNFLSEDVIETRGIANPFLTPKSIDYKKEIDGNFHPKYVFDAHGWLTECTYYSKLEISQNQLGFTVYNYSDPILKYEAAYVIKDDGYVGSRQVTRRWYRLDGTLDSDAKVTEKFYQPMQAREEGRIRRQNLINNLIIDTVGLIIITSPDLNTVPEAETDAIGFMREVAAGIAEYYEYGTKQDANGNPCRLIQDVTNSNYSRLNNYVPGTNNTVTIRQFIISKLNPQ